MWKFELYTLRLNAERLGHPFPTKKYVYLRVEQGTSHTLLRYKTLSVIFIVQLSLG